MSHNHKNARLFWAFSQAVYACRGVSQACLSLQDNHDADVNILLFAAWSGAAFKAALQHDEIDRIVRESADWRDHVVWPLRAVRRAVKTRLDRLPEGIDPYATLKEAELATEQAQQYMLALWYSDLGRRVAHKSGEELAAANMMTYMAVLGRDGSPDLSGPVAVIARAAAGTGGAPQNEPHRE